MKTLSKTTDEYLLSATVRDINDFFEQEKTFLIDYYGHLKDATMKSDKMVNKHKGKFTVNNLTSLSSTILTVV